MLDKIEVNGTVGVMWADTVSGKFLDSLSSLLIYTPLRLHYQKATMSWHEMARNQLVQDMLGDWILMLDTDHVFAPDLLERLLAIKEKHKAPIVSGIYAYKFPPHAPVANMWDESQTDRIRVSPILDWDRSAEVMEVGCVGAGCLLIDRKVFKQIEYSLSEAPFSIVPGLSEDYSFCYRCKKLGIPILLAPQIECHHVIPTVLSVRDYVAPLDVKPIRAVAGIVDNIGYHSVK